MTRQITITHRIKARSVATTVRMPGKDPITKTWHLQPDNNYMLDNCNGWEDEDLPDEVIEAAECSPIRVCDVFDDGAVTTQKGGGAE